MKNSSVTARRKIKHPHPTPPHSTTIIICVGTEFSGTL